MMDLNDRIGWLLIGCAIGFVFGYIVRSLRDIKEELDEVDTIVKKQHGEEGFVRNAIVMDVALLLVVVLTVWAAFASQRASNEIQSTQERITRVTVCSQQYLSKTIKALNERTTYNEAQANLNVDLQRSQAEFLAIVLAEPPVAEEKAEAALETYFDALTEFVKVTGKAEVKATNFPYPTNEELSQCLNPN